MTRIELNLYVDPGEAEIVFNVKRVDDSYERIVGIIDTGAEVSLLPVHLMSSIQHRTDTDTGQFVIEQAGIAKQEFQAIEAYITLFLEDAAGNRTQPFEALVWFGETKISLIGFRDILDKSILHIDMPQMQGWLEIDR